MLKIAEAFEARDFKFTINKQCFITTLVKV